MNSSWTKATSSGLHSLTRGEGSEDGSGISRRCSSGVRLTASSSSVYVGLHAPTDLSTFSSIATSNRFWRVTASSELRASTGDSSTVGVSFSGSCCSTSLLGGYPPTLGSCGTRSRSFFRANQSQERGNTSEHITSSRFRPCSAQRRMSSSSLGHTGFWGWTFPMTKTLARSQSLKRSTEYRSEYDAKRLTWMYFVQRNLLIKVAGNPSRTRASDLFFGEETKPGVGVFSNSSESS